MKALLRVAVLAIVLALLSASFASAKTPIEGWYGDYAYTQSFGRTAGGGSSISADYRVTLSKGNPGCVIEISGFQTAEVIFCVATASVSDVVLRFKSYDTGDTKNAFGVAVYKPNATLLKLERVTKNGQPRLITHWLAMERLDGKKPAPGVQFKRKAP